MKVLVTGAAGRLGAEIVRCLQGTPAECLGVDREDFDVRDGDAVHRAVAAFTPDVIVHCAAYTDTQRAETEPEKCAEVNGLGTLNIVRAALKNRAKLVYISDAAVFSGEGAEPWEAEDRPNARTVYGMSKGQGEEVIRSLMSRYFIIRTSWLYGGAEDDFVQQLARRTAEKGELTVAAGETAAPTWVVPLAQLVCGMLTTERYGVYHAACQGWCTRADVARMTAEMVRGRAVIKADRSHPVNSRLSCVSLERAGFAPLPHWEDALTRYLAENL